MKKQLRDIVKGIGSTVVIYPSTADLPRVLQRFVTPPKTVEESFLADADALRQDWERVEPSMRWAITGTDHVETDR